MRTYGRRGHAEGVYPQGSNGGGSSAPRAAFAFDQNDASYSQVSGGLTLQIATATITVAEGSSIKVEALASVLGSVAAGRAFISTPSIASLLGSQSFGTTEGTNYRTLNYLGMTDPQVAGLVTISMFIDVNGGAGARVDSAGKTVLTLTEIPA